MPDEKLFTLMHPIKPGAKKEDSPFKPIKPAVPSYIRDLSAEIDHKTHSIIRGEMRDGVRIITYTLDGTLKRNHNHDCLQYLARINNDQLVSAIEKALARIESIANVKFVRVTGEESDTADIRFFEGVYAVNSNQLAYQSDLNTKTRDIVLRKDLLHPITKKKLEFKDYGYTTGGSGYRSILHETMHAMGISHPGETGIKVKNNEVENMAFNPAYNTSSTIMSSNDPAFIGGVNDLGPYDIAALQYHYGAPNNSPSSFDTAFLKSYATLHAQKPANIDFRRATEKGDLKIDLAQPKFDYQIRGSLEDGYFHQVVARFGVDTKINDILTHEDCQISLNLTGNELPNRLQGSAKIDRLEAHGGNDILTGRGSADTFVFGNKSNTGNIITDFNAKDGDTIKAPYSCTRIELREHQKCAADGKNERGTQVIFYNSDNDIIADAFAVNATPHDIKPQLKTDRDISISTSRVLEPEQCNPNHHLPTLPPAHGRRRIFK